MEIVNSLKVFDNYYNLGIVDKNVSQFEIKTLYIKNIEIESTGESNYFLEEFMLSEVLKFTKVNENLLNEFYIFFEYVNKSSTIRVIYKIELNNKEEYEIKDITRMDLINYDDFYKTKILYEYTRNIFLFSFSSTEKSFKIYFDNKHIKDISKIEFEKFTFTSIYSKKEHFSVFMKLLFIVASFIVIPIICYFVILKYILPTYWPSDVEKTKTEITKLQSEVKQKALDANNTKKELEKSEVKKQEPNGKSAEETITEIIDKKKAQ